MADFWLIRQWQGSFYFFGATLLEDIGQNLLLLHRSGCSDTSSTPVRFLDLIRACCSPRCFSREHPVVGSLGVKRPGLCRQVEHGINLTL